MQIDESPDTESRSSESINKRRANRILASLLAAIFGVAGCCSAPVIYDAYLAGGVSILHPNHAMFRAIGGAVFVTGVAAYFAWAAVTGRPLWYQD